MPYMSQQLLFVPTADLVLLLRRHTLQINSMPTASFREAALAANPGAVALVLDETGSGIRDAAEPAKLILAGMRSISRPGTGALASVHSECTWILARIHMDPMQIGSLQYAHVSYAKWFLAVLRVESVLIVFVPRWIFVVMTVVVEFGQRISSPVHAARIGTLHSM